TIGIKYIGRWLTGSPRLWLNDSISSVDELKNKKIRSAPNYNRFFDELGITSVMIDPSEVYTSLQTGVVDGFVYGGLSGPRQDGWTDSSKYVLDIPFWTQNCVILFNGDSWDRIDEKDQEAIIAATGEYEREMVAYYEDIFEEERQELLDDGVEFITLSEQDTEYFLDLAYDTEWDYIAAEEPEIVEEVRHLTESE
ncbi:MAG TPA: TRAP transporter substrate-binding protein DctP, partial [Pseudogracilibacillus sp.]|nr:TRAP transporter substrate-binding protein DctP [Pseudogracilibacillus sp.]